MKGVARVLLHRIDREGSRRRERALLVGFSEAKSPAASGSSDLEELARLARTAGVEVAAVARQRREQIDPAYFVGSGKAREIAAAVRSQHHDLVIFDNDLSPRQSRNLEALCRVPVIDRTELILDIFAMHARTAQAQMQVDLARHEYQLPRLRRLWTHLSRIHGGGGGALGALRGPGEKQIEMDRQELRRRITDLRRSLAAVESRRQREVDHRSDLFSVSLVGYTNAGKSTLLNALTGSSALVADQLFSTLDTLTRVWSIKGRCRVLLSDTVGFIERLPTHLVSTFHATLAETRSADLILHVVDASALNAPEQIRAVNGVLEAIGAGGRQTLLVFNKADRVTSEIDLRWLENEYPGNVVVCAKSGFGLDALADAVALHLERTRVEIVAEIAAADGKAFALLREHGKILESIYPENECARVRAAIDPREEGKIAKHLATHGGRYDRVHHDDRLREHGASGGL
jgi:GTP-binding protein HflX